MNLQKKLTSRMASLKGRREEGADIVQTILIIVLFVVVVIIVGGLLMNAIEGQAKGVSDCISGANKISNCKDYGSNG